MMSERDTLPILLVFGLSGAGKSNLGSLAESNLNFLHIEQDESSRLGPDLWAYVIEDWRYFLEKKDPYKLASKVRQLSQEANKVGAILTFDSVQSPSVEQIERAREADMLMIILHGEAEDCMHSSLERDSHLSKRTEERWHQFNDHTSTKFNRQEYDQYRVLAFENHVRKSPDVLLDILKVKTNEFNGFGH
jgi:hypothetical protein